MRKYLVLAIFLTVLAIYFLSLNGVWATDHPSSFIQLDWSIWSAHSFAVNNSQAAGNPVFSMDDFALNGQWYIAAPPGLSFFSLPFVIPAFILDGYTPFGHVLLFSEAFVAFMGAISACLMFEISKMFFKLKTSVFLSFALAFSTLLWPFATYYFQHDVSTAFVLLVFYLALKISRENSPGFRLYALCGLALGSAILVDYINALIIPILGVFFLFKSRRLSGVLTFVYGGALGIVAVLAYNFVAFGSAFTTSQNLYDKKALLGDFTTPLYQGLFLNFLSPYRGLFIYCPILILGPIGLYLMFRRKVERSEIFLLIAIFLSIVIPYSMWQDVTAGVSFGPRFLIPAIPFLLLPVGAVIEKGKVPKNIGYILYSVGAVFNGSAALVSVIHPNFSTAPSWTTQIIGYMVQNLATGSLDVWWQNLAGDYWWVVAAAVIATPIVIPVLVNRRLTNESTAKDNAVEVIPVISRSAPRRET